MIFEALEVGIYGANCYIAGSEETKEAAIIDPGSEFDKIDKKINDLGLTPKIVILTHYHGDHIAAVQEFIDKYGTKVYIHKGDAEALNDSSMNFSKTMFGKGVSIKADVELKDGDEITLGELKFEIIHTPGHTKGDVSIKV